MENINWIAILLDLIITASGYLFLPAIIRIFIGKIEQRKAKKIAIINAIVVDIAFFIIASAISGETPKVNILPAIFWGTIGYSLINGEYNNEENKARNDKIICKYCGSKNSPKKEYCFMCRKKLDADIVKKDDELSQEELDYANTILSNSKGIVNENDVNAFIWILHTYITQGKDKALSEFEELKNSLVDKYKATSISKISYFLGILNANNIISESEMKALLSDYTSEITKKVLKDYTNADNSNYYNKCKKILTLIEENIDTNSLDETICKLYQFYTSQGIDLPFDLLYDIENLKENDKLDKMILILKTGMGKNDIDDIDEIYEDLYAFYKAQNK